MPPRPTDVPGLGNDLEVRLGIEQQLQPAAHHLMIVGEHDPHRLLRAELLSARSLLISHLANVTISPGRHASATRRSAATRTIRL